jgi:hypothetical protein
VPLCEQSLRREFNALSQEGDGVASGDSAAPKRLSLTFIGIGKNTQMS